MRTHRRLMVVVAGLAAAAAAALAPPASAGSGGTPDTVHGNVGALLLQPFPGGNYLVCSGSLISASHFLTAAHCLVWADGQGFGPDDFAVTFDGDLEGRPDGAVTPEQTTPVAAYALHPAYTPRVHGTDDVAVVTLAEPVTDVAPVRLPTEGLLDQAAARGGLRGHSFVNVGYGVDATRSGRPAYSFDGVRRSSTSPYEGLTSDFLLLNMQAAATGEGGSCFGDSGAPKFYEEAGPRADVAVATTSGGDRVCRAHNYNVRLDTPRVRAFLDDFVAVP